MKKFNKILTQILVALLITTIFMALAVTLIGSPDAYAKYYDDWEVEPYMEHSILEEDGYIYYEGFFEWEGDTLVSAKCEYNNASQVHNVKVGWCDPKFMGYSPLTVEQFESQSFTEFSPEPVEENKLVKENEDLKAENKSLTNQFKALSEQVESIMKVLSSLNL